ncbi:hypothetical protein BJV77DRAFT_966545 [Russula vinacea]|nr:hypothetical protein BJV77DRAFT_966545 [Russula vinacea]
MTEIKSERLQCEVEARAISLIIPSVGVQWVLMLAARYLGKAMQGNQLGVPQEHWHSVMRCHHFNVGQTVALTRQWDVAQGCPHKGGWRSISSDLLTKFSKIVSAIICLLLNVGNNYAGDAVAGRDNPITRPIAEKVTSYPKFLPVPSGNQGGNALFTVIKRHNFLPASITAGSHEALLVGQFNPASESAEARPTIPKRWYSPSECVVHAYNAFLELEDGARCNMARPRQGSWWRSNFLITACRCQLGTGMMSELPPNPVLVHAHTPARFMLGDSV